MMAIKLKLVGLISEVLLNHDSGTVAVPGIMVRDLYMNDVRRIRFTFFEGYKFLEFLNQI